jgi:putative aldouronate transport system permease protein
VYRKTLGEKVFDVALIIFFIILSVIMVFPFYNVVMNSLVSRGEYFSRAIILWPNELYLTSYAFIFSSEKLMRSLLITAFITVVGTIYSMFITVMLSYGLSKRYFPGRKILLTLIMITIIIAFTTLITSIFLNTLWLNIMMGKAFIALLPPRIIASLITIPVYAVVIKLFLKHFKYAVNEIPKV